MNEAESNLSPRAFETTQWTLLRAAADSRAPGFRPALEVFCQRYWYPLYAFARRSGNGPEEARDLTQDFFHHCLSSDVLKRADPGRGRFRSYLMVLLRNFLRKAHRDRSRLKRGGGAVHVPIEWDAAEGRYGQELADEISPEVLFDRNWVRELMREVTLRLREEYAAAGEGERFAALRFALEGVEAVPYPEVAARLGLSIGGVKSAVFRLRARFRELFREVVAETLDDTRDVDAEIRHLLQALG